MTDQSPQAQVESASEAFEQEFERFSRFTGDPSTYSALDLETAIGEERALADLRTRHLGKKSALAATKKLIGRVEPDQRAAFGQLVQSIEAKLLEQLDHAEQNLKTYIEAERTARESIDVTMPGRFLVFMPTVNHVSVSRKIESREERARLRGIVRQFRDAHAFNGGVRLR